MGSETMAATVRQLENEPILIVIHEGFLDVPAAAAVTAQVARILEASSVPLYGIIDLRAATTDMPTLLHLLAYERRGARGMISYDPERIVLVGGHPLLRIYRRLLQREPLVGRYIPIYSTLEDAIAAQRARIREAEQR